VVQLRSYQTIHDLMRKIREQDRVSADTYSVYRGAERRFILFEDVYNSIKVKFTLVQALRLCTGRTAHRESRGIAVLL